MVSGNSTQRAVLRRLAPPGFATHVGCSVLAAALTVGFVLFVGVGTLFATLSVLGYLSTTVFVWLVLAWWVVWWLVVEALVDRVNRPTPGPDLG